LCVYLSAMSFSVTCSAAFLFYCFQKCFSLLASLGAF
jgi:hypothetical protein